MSDLRTTLAKLYTRIPQGQKLGLERMEAACATFGHPERSFRTVHVAGTNGKGSVCAFVGSMLRASGQRVGVYTSPHLCQFAERINIGGEQIDNDELGAILEEVLERAPDLTFFEVTTLTAFLAFKRANVETAVIEVGLGGRLDATNVVPGSNVVAITRIAFDHIADLGDSLMKIGAEKAGIIKAGSQVVLGKIHPDARQAIERRIQEVGAQLVELGDPEPYPGAQLAYPRMAMFGTNLAVATTVGRHLGIEPEVMARGIEETHWPGRNELLHRAGLEPTLLDCAHNPDGAVMLSHIIEMGLSDLLGSRREAALVFGTKADKNWKAMLDRLQNSAWHRIYVAPPIRSAVDPELMTKHYPGEVAPNVEAALQRARELAGERGLVVVTGSIFLVGAARAALLGIECDPPVEM